MTEGDPPPLKSAGETPAELVRALRALGQSDRDAARLARVAEQLGAKVAAGSGASAASWLRRLTGTKTGLIGLVLGVGVLGVLGYALIADRRAAVPASSPVAAPVVVPAAPPPAATPIQQLPVLSPASEPAQPLTQARAPARPSRSARVARSTEHAAAEPSHVAAQVEPVPASASTAPEQPRPKPTPAEPAAAAEPAAQPSELMLLHQARKSAVKEPAAALNVLREHAQRFPSGLLTPEREVLTIEVLRRLGRSAEAAQRLEQFKLRHPKSIYLRRLEHE
ncbi:MAG TPA: hypothetical protein VK509_06185 [Polyangiales bacterium]|nr:hypothetical protein [Polyangiales bacterium]